MNEAALRENWPDVPAGAPYSALRRLSEHETGKAKPETAANNATGYSGAKRVYVGTGTCIGWRAIAEYLGVSDATARRWSERWQLPVCRLPDGRVMTTLSLIDQWVMARIEAQKAERDA